MDFLAGVKNQKVRLLLEIVLVAVIFLSIRRFLGIKYAAQIAELISLVAITYFIKARGVSWYELGLRPPSKWLLAVLYFVLCVASIALLFNFVIQPLFPHGANDINHGEPVSLNEMLFQLIIIGIGAAAIGEEMLFRGFLLNQLNQIFGKSHLATIAAIALQAFIFGVLHSGVQGMVSAGVIGVILGIFYVLSGRNLLVVMAAHAVPDVLSIISSYQSQ